MTEHHRLFFVVHRFVKPVAFNDTPSSSMPVGIGMGLADG